MSQDLTRPARLLVPVLACVLCGLLVGGLWTLLQPTRFRADAHVLVRPATPRTVAGVEALAESSLVAENIAQTLHVTAPDVTATPGEGGVLTVSVTGEGERARQLDAEALILLTQLAPRRFRLRRSRSPLSIRRTSPSRRAQRWGATSSSASSGGSCSVWRRPSPAPTPRVPLDRRFYSIRTGSGAWRCGSRP